MLENILCTFAMETAIVSTEHHVQSDFTFKLYFVEKIMQISDHYTAGLNLLK